MNKRSHMMEVWRPVRQAFTLIELLITVAIISILAAVAVPNFLLASTRAKASRAAADQRSVVTALECYAVDNAGRYPAYGNGRDAGLFVGEPIVFLPVRVTTPIAYLATLPPDIFPGTRTGITYDFADTFFYMHDYETVYLGKSQQAGHVSEHYRTLTGGTRPVKWTIWSYGPDLKDNHGTLLYDATNGVLSKGDLMRFGP